MEKEKKSLSKRIKNLIAEVGYFIIIKIHKFPKVATIDETIEKILKDKCSIARFGDGEIRLLENEKISFQNPDEKLSKKLNEVIESNEENLLVALPPIFTYKDLKETSKGEALFWKKEVVLKYKQYKKIKNNKKYYNACMTRPYLRYLDKSNVRNIFENMKKIWKEKEILIIEGKETRLGIGNDLFDNVRAIFRILCPQRDAFSKYDEILKEALKVSKDKLVIIALGPTATVLAYDLSKEGYQALDLGHFDIEYEWFKMGATEKIKIKGKYTNEVIDGDKVENIMDKEYQKQILTIID